MNKHHRPTTKTANPQDLETVVLPKGRFWITIPPAESFTAEERALFESGQYPFTVCEHLPEHVAFLDFLVEQGVAAWKGAPQDRDANPDRMSRDTQGGER